jgi:xylulokinase
MLSAGGSLQWAREVLYPVELCAAATSEARDRVYATMIREAAAGDRDGREAALFHPYLTGERCPYPHPHARGGWLGLTRAATRADLVRAVLVGITLGMGRQVNLIRSLGVEPSDVRLAGGGARNAWWRQLQADVYGVRCVVLQSEQGSALGAAILAAVGSGHFTSVQAACDAMLRVKSEHRPAPRRTAYFRRLGELTTKAYEAIEPLYRCGWDR